MTKFPNDHEIKLRVSDPLYLSIAKGAAAEDRPVGEYLRRIIEQHMWGEAYMRDLPHALDFKGGQNSGPTGRERNTQSSLRNNLPSNLRSPYK